MNGDWKPDWNKKNQSKYFINYDYSVNKYDVDFCFLTIQTSIVFKKVKSAQKAIEIMGDKLDYIYKQQ